MPYIKEPTKVQESSSSSRTSQHPHRTSTITKPSNMSSSYSSLWNRYYCRSTNSRNLNLNCMSYQSCNSCYVQTAIIVVVLLGTVILYNVELLGQTDPTFVPSQSIKVETTTTNKAFLSSTKQYYEEENLCYDRTDPEEWKEISNKRNCNCPTPGIATKELRNNQPEWLVHHETMQQDLQYELFLQQQQQQKSAKVKQQPLLDVLFLGDSIMERWNGTRSMGVQHGTQFQEFRHSFDSMFNQRRSLDTTDTTSTTTTTTTAQLQGLLLGSSGDITSELFWHIQNLPCNIGRTTTNKLCIVPKVFFLLIGTNDLGRMECSTTSTVTGIIQIINYLHAIYPTTPILVHGLLPRSDTYNKGNYELGRYWENILVINDELETYCTKKGQTLLLHYMDASHLFLTSSDTSNTNTMLNETVMSDSLHPDVLGYNLWGQEIVQRVLQIIS
jgi:lysophospholipase L1-like esterase